MGQLRRVIANNFSFGGRMFRVELVPTSQPEANVRVLGSEEFASTRELRPFSRSTHWFPLTKGYREPLAKNPESGGTCGFCSSTGMVFKKAEEDCGEWPSGTTAYGHEPLLSHGGVGPRAS